MWLTVSVHGLAIHMRRATSSLNGMFVVLACAQLLAVPSSHVRSPRKELYAPILPQVMCYACYAYFLPGFDLCVYQNASSL